MATGSGLDAQVGVKIESPVGTAATVDRFFEFESADIALEPSYIEGNGIRAGHQFKSIGEVGIARFTAAGKLALPFMMNSMGWWFKPMFGSAATLASATVVSGGTDAYEQYHIPAGLRGISFTTQIGKPEPSTGTVQPANYNGCKITDWEIAFEDNGNTMLNVSVDAWNEAASPSLQVASYVDENPLYNFSHVNSVKLGGTPSTTSSICSISGGTTVSSIITSLSIAGKNTMATDRFGLGSAGVKAEQLETDFTSITGSFKAEYLASEFQSEFKAGTTTSLQITSTGGVIESTTHYKLDIIIPAIKITKAPATVSGPGLVSIDGEFMAYDDGTNAPIQVHYVSTDTTT